eukprot:COSAG06_NODE_2527_length_6720_cov_2.669687_5_plen_183_part_00
MCRGRSRLPLPRCCPKLSRARTSIMMVQRSLVLAGLVSTASGHGAVTHPRPRQAIDGAISPWCATCAPKQCVPPRRSHCIDAYTSGCAGRTPFRILSRSRTRTGACKAAERKRRRVDWRLHAPTGACAHDHLLLVGASQVCAPGRGLQGPAQAEWLQRPGMLLYVCARSRSSSVRARAHARA